MEKRSRPERNELRRADGKAKIQQKELEVKVSMEHKQMQTCSNCELPVDADATFCASCGTPVTPAICCPQCAKALSHTANFCKHCGFDLATTQVHTPPRFTASLDDTPPAVSVPHPVEQFTMFQTYTAPTPDATTTDNPASFISPAGAAFTVICFFLPWFRISGCDRTVIVSGWDLAKGDSSLWLLPVMGVSALVAYFVCKNQRTLFKARWPITGSSVLALCFFGYKVYSVLKSSPTEGTQIKSGSIGTIIGFVLAIAGCAFMSRPNSTSDPVGDKNQAT